MSDINTRNNNVTSFLNTILNKALDSTLIIDEKSYKTDIDNLFSTEAWGFREILLVALVGMKLDSSFKASTGLYDCNPRAIYEGPIKDFLMTNSIPHRKSGPLNVAKAAKGLDTTWASQRRPAKVAKSVVNIINYIEKNPHKLDDLATSLLKRLLLESKKVSSLIVELEPSNDPIYLFDLCEQLINKVPDSGNTPQKIVALLLSNYHKGLSDSIIVTGLEDRASVTSTTSKKPGDVNEESIDGKIFNVYEITVKPFDLARIQDSYDCVSKYNESAEQKIKEISVICRVQDCPAAMTKTSKNSFLGSFPYNDMMYYFVDIYEWILSKLLESTRESREKFYSDLNDYINDINTSKAVKNLWNTLHNE